jgi:hypothetical protein
VLFLLAIRYVCRADGPEAFLCASPYRQQVDKVERLIFKDPREKVMPVVPTATRSIAVLGDSHQSDEVFGCLPSHASERFGCLKSLALTISSQLEEFLPEIGGVGEKSPRLFDFLPPRPAHGDLPCFIQSIGVQSVRGIGIRGATREELAASRLKMIRPRDFAGVE